MDESKLRMELQKSMMLAGLEYYHPADTGFTEVARPDILSVSGCVIEVKRIDEKIRIEPWFDPKMIPNRQRRQLDYYSWRLQTYLTIGTTFGKPRKMWVIPWESWIIMEKELLDADNPDVEKLRIPISEIENRWDNYYGLIWQGNGTWKFKNAHPIMSLVRERSPHDWEPKSIRFKED